MSRLTIQQILSNTSVIPILTVTRVEDAVPLARALARGGLRVLELTLRTPCALDALSAIRAEVPEAIVGAGTLVRPPDIDDALAAGASFGVTPGLTPDLVKAIGESELPILPGIMTPSELISARAASFTICKLFPAQQAGGVAMLKALSGPFPDQMFCPTGGITRQNAAEFLALPNVLCVGGSWFAPPALLDARDWGQIEQLALDAATLGAV
ncbi:MAG: bifunctional 4-hydroxy-2-oxoglutarate aldolase/2-dehydro-3-deoxy-phosphogluconate aldolase [Proteobacteria bacterium]|nr:bifunctional 4-hydroxy-2-oxoglutarate aldolase/2-dehydro-3-deoxy-phosphogluconate aldolase [Pseudomonadota bacterium]HQR02548.1 bifunctional 4-hydroxy-2-oxoglutarate aldolase/2-dehydro-3-deoxy-phosphogluconate aldolase [Rhodocyclaceae bacterium]